MSVDNVRMTDKTTGELLLDLKRRAGLSLDAIAKRAGYSGRSSVQQFFSASYDRPLDTDVASKLAVGLQGFGAPPIEMSEVFVLTGMSGAAMRGFVHETGAPIVGMKQDIPIIGTALAPDRPAEGGAIEQTYVDRGVTVGYAWRPTLLDRRTDVYSLYVPGSSMSPAFESGDLVLVEYRRPPRIGDNVIVYLRDGGDGRNGGRGPNERAALLKRLVRRSGSCVELEQYNPRLTFTLDAADVIEMHRIMTLNELLS